MLRNSADVIIFGFFKHRSHPKIWKVGISLLILYVAAKEKSKEYYGMGVSDIENALNSVFRENK